MKQFLAVYVGTSRAHELSGWDKLDDAARKKLQQDGMNAWLAWGEQNASRIVFNGGPLGKTKRTGPDGVSDIKNNLAGFVVLEAETHEEAALLFENHPHFSIFPGDSVEIMECLPIPTL